MQVNKKLLKDWGISIADYESGEWGTSVGKFRVYPTIIKRFRKTITNTDGTKIDVFDVQRCFDEVATTYVTAILATYEIARQIKFTWFEEDTQENLKKAVYNAIEYAALNKQFWENVNGSAISTPNFNVTVDQTSWMLTTDMFGMKAHNFLTLSGIDEYTVYSLRDFYSMKTVNGNERIVGKIDLAKFPELQ